MQTPTHPPRKARRRQPAAHIPPVHHAFNPARAICDHLVGPSHTTIHRMVVGVFIMASGVFFSKLGTDHITHFISELAGFAVHGIGLMPFVDKIVELIKD